MRIFILSAMVASGLMVTGAAPALAVGSRHAFCLSGNEYPGLSYCDFDTYEQCRAEGSGRALQCIANPYFAGDASEPTAYPARRMSPGYWPGYDQSR